MTSSSTERRDVAGNWYRVSMALGFTARANELRHVGVNMFWQLLSFIYRGRCAFRGGPLALYSLLCCKPHLRH